MKTPDIHPDFLFRAARLLERPLNQHEIARALAELWAEAWKAGYAAARKEQS